MPADMCVNCQTEYKCVRQGIIVFEMFNDPPIPCAIWSADMQQCKCGRLIVSGYGHNPILRHYEEGFELEVERLLNDENTITIELHERKNPQYFVDKEAECE